MRTIAAPAPFSYLSPKLLESPLLPVVQFPDRLVPGILKVGKGLLRDLTRPHLFLRFEAQARQRKPQGRWSRLRSRGCLSLVVESPVDSPLGKESEGALVSLHSHPRVAWRRRGKTLAHSVLI